MLDKAAHCHYKVTTHKTLGTNAMSTSALYQMRIDEQEKAETFAIFEEMGIKPAQAVRLFFRQVRKTHALPFPIECTPNEKTAKALLKSDEEKSYERVNSVEDLFADLRKTDLRQK